MATGANTAGGPPMATSRQVGGRCGQGREGQKGKEPASAATGSTNVYVAEYPDPPQQQSEEATEHDEGTTEIPASSPQRMVFLVSHASTTVRHWSIT